MKNLSLLMIFFLVSCGPSLEEKEVIAINACSIMGETKKHESLFRIQTMIDAREKIGGETFIGGDAKILEAFEWGLCKKLVLSENYDESLQFLKDFEREKQQSLKDFEREKQRIADSKPSTKETFHSNGQLDERTNYQPKSDGGLLHGPYEKYYKSGAIRDKGNYKYGKLDGPYKSYCGDGKFLRKANFKNGEFDGLVEEYPACDDGNLRRINYKNGVKDGLDESLCYNGNPAHRIFYKNGVKHGPFERYFSYLNCNGQLADKGNYVDGKVQDGYQSYNEYGENITKDWDCLLNPERTGIICNEMRTGLRALPQP
jgi:antitoxin component YwqK of YwqJK toxin-antitoxin module